MRMFLYVLASLVSFLVFMVIFLPAAPVFSMVRDDVTKAAPDLNIYRIGGTVWSGDADLQFRQFPASTLTWDLAAFPLLGGQANTDLNLKGTGIELAGTLNASNSQIEASGFTGALDAEFINVVSTQYGFTFTGTLNIVALDLTSDTVRVTALNGNLAWDGGRIILQTPDGSRGISLPPLTGVLSADGDRLFLHVEHNGEPLLVISLKPDGWAEVDVKERLLALADLPRQGGDLDASAVLLEEKIL